MTKYIILIAVLFAQITNILYSQEEKPKDFPQMRKRDVFFADPLVFSVGDSTNGRLDLYLEISEQGIMFKKNPVSGNLESSLSLSVIINNSANKNVSSKNYFYSYSHTEGEMKSNPRNSHFELLQFPLAFGDYTLYLTMLDLFGNSTFKKEYKITVKDFSKNLIQFSDIMILSDYKIDSLGNKSISPLISNNVFEKPDFYMFFEIYNNTTTSQKKTYLFKLYDEEKTVLAEGSFSDSLLAGKSIKIQKVSTDIEQLRSKALTRKKPDGPPGEMKEIPGPTIVITDSSTNEVLAIKKCRILPPDLPPMDMERKGPPHGKH